MVGAAGIELEALSRRERGAAGAGACCRNPERSEGPLPPGSPTLWLLRMVGAAGIEPATLGLEIRCSIRLSYAPECNVVLHDSNRLSCSNAHLPAETGTRRTAIFWNASCRLASCSGERPNIPLHTSSIIDKTCSVRNTGVCCSASPRRSQIISASVSYSSAGAPIEISPSMSSWRRSSFTRSTRFIFHLLSPH
jgi:hypothetical protein